MAIDLSITPPKYDPNFISSSSESYNVAHSGGTISLSMTSFYGMVGQTVFGGTYAIRRYPMFFWTDGIPTGATIDSGNLQVYKYADDSTTDFDITIVSHSCGRPAVASDWPNFGTTSFGSLNTSQFINGWNTINLNSSGLAYINRRGYTTIALVSNNDISQTPPTNVEVIAVHTSRYTYPAKLNLSYSGVTVSLDLTMLSTESAKLTINRL